MQADTLEKRRLQLVVFTMVLALAVNVVSARYGLGWRSAAAITAVVLVLDLLFVWRTRDGVLAHWLVLALVAGFLELIADWWMVARTGTLVYPADEPHIWASPAYMPFAWATVLVQIGVIAARIRRSLALVPATLATALVSAAYIPIYEHVAKDANWWYYRDTPMLYSAPYYIIGGEFLVAIPLTAMAAVVARRRLGWTLGLGLVQGAWMLPAFMIAFFVFGPCSGALIQLGCRP